MTIYGYRGKHLEQTVPDLPVEEVGDDRLFTGCEEGKLKSWVAFVDTAEGDAFYGYNGEPGRTEDFWILDVDGTRLVIETNWSPASPREDVAELRPSSTPSGSSPDLLEVAETPKVLLHLVGLGVADARLVVAARHAGDLDCGLRNLGL